MMDTKTRNLLRKWHFSSYVNVFQEHCIDFDTLLSLTGKDLMVLFDNKIGLKRKFQSKRKEFSLSVSVSKEFAFDLRQDAVQETEASLDPDDVKREEIDLGTFTLEAASNNSQLQSLLGQQTRQHVEVSGSQQDDSVNLHEQSENSSNEVQLLQLHSDSACPSISHDRKTYVEQSLLLTADDNVLERNQISPCKGAMDVEFYLKKTCIGRGALKFGSMGKTLDAATRSKVCHEIIVGEVGPDGSNQITSFRFEQLAEGLVQLFPAEIKETYFIPRRPANGLQRAAQPKGLLYDKYNNLLKFLRKCGLRSSIRSKTGAREINYEDKPKAAANLFWLENHSLDSEITTKNKWITCVLQRVAWLQTLVDPVGKCKIGEHELEKYFNKFQCLSTSWGLELLLGDFEFMYGGKYFSLIDNWPTVSSKILTMAGSLAKDVEPGDVGRCLKLIPTFFRQPIMGHGSKQDRRIWKPNVAESCQGFLLYVTVASELQSEIQRIREKCRFVNKSFHIFPATVSSEGHPNDSFVVINNMCYRMKSPLEAVDTCFKLFHALHCLYPCQSSYSWQFLQQAVYGLNTQWDITVPAVTTKVQAYKDLKI